MSYRTPLDLQNEARERGARERGAREPDVRPPVERDPVVNISQHVPPSDPALMTPADLEVERRANAERERGEAQAQIEMQRKDRARRAYVAGTGGSEEGFEQAYPALRETMIREETLRRVRAEDVPVGTLTEQGVRW